MKKALKIIGIILLIGILWRFLPVLLIIAVAGFVLATIWGFIVYHKNQQQQPPAENQAPTPPPQQVPGQQSGPPRYAQYQQPQSAAPPPAYTAASTPQQAASAQVQYEPYKRRLTDEERDKRAVILAIFAGLAGGIFIFWISGGFFTQDQSVAIENEIRVDMPLSHKATDAAEQPPGNIPSNMTVSSEAASGGTSSDPHLKELLKQADGAPIIPDELWKKWNPSYAPNYILDVGLPVFSDFLQEDGIMYLGFDRQGRNCGVKARLSQAYCNNPDIPRRSVFEKDNEPSGYPRSNLQVSVPLSNGHTYNGDLWNATWLLPDTLGGEAVKRNIVTGTAMLYAGATYQNQTGGMLACFNEIRSWIDNHPNDVVHYEAIPMYDGIDNIPRAVLVNYSNQDATLSKRYVAYNAAKGVNIDYSGWSSLASSWNSGSLTALEAKIEADKKAAIEEEKRRKEEEARQQREAEEQTRRDREAQRQWEKEERERQEEEERQRKREESRNYYTPSSTATPISSSTEQTENDSRTVYKTKTGKCYHRSNCRTLSKSKIPTTVAEAQAEGLTPCEICAP